MAALYPKRPADSYTTSRDTIAASNRLSYAAANVDSQRIKATR